MMTGRKELIRSLSCIYFIGLLVSFGTSGCSADKTGDNTVIAAEKPRRAAADCRYLYANARALDSTLLVAVETNDSVAEAAIGAFTTFAVYCDHDSMSPVFLIKTAQVARAVGKHAQAKQALENCISTYREFVDRPAAIFLLAQLYEDKTFMQDRDEAEKLYQQVIDEYPGTVWADNAKGALLMVGKSEEEIIKMLKKGPR